MHLPSPIPISDAFPKQRSVQRHLSPLHFHLPFHPGYQPRLPHPNLKRKKTKAKTFDERKQKKTKKATRGREQRQKSNKKV
jgi:hypothetical protein